MERTALTVTPDRPAERPIPHTAWIGGRTIGPTTRLTFEEDSVRVVPSRTQWASIFGLWAVFSLPAAVTALADLGWISLAGGPHRVVAYGLAAIMTVACGTAVVRSRSVRVDFRTGTITFREGFGVEPRFVRPLDEIAEIGVSEWVVVFDDDTVGVVPSTGYRGDEKRRARTVWIDFRDGRCLRPFRTTDRRVVDRFVTRLQNELTRPSGDGRV